MNMIVAVDSNWAIGKNNRLLVSIPRDMKYFREITRGKVVVVGRKTLESFPDKKPLPHRTNIVLSSNRNYKAKGALVVHSIEELLKEIDEKYNRDDVFVIGGDNVYSQLIKYCDTAYVTKIDYEYDADTFFPNLDIEDEWMLTMVTEEETYFDLTYRFMKYEKKKDVRK